MGVFQGCLQAFCLIMRGINAVLGFIAEDFTVESMRATLCRLSNEDIMKAKYQSNMAARQLCFEVEGKSLAKLLDLV